MVKNGVKKALAEQAAKHQRKKKNHYAWSGVLSKIESPIKEKALLNEKGIIGSSKKELTKWRHRDIIVTERTDDGCYPE